MKDIEKNGMEPELLMELLVLPIHEDIANFCARLGMEYHATVNVEGAWSEINTPDK